MRIFISSKRLIKIDLKSYIDVRFKLYWKYNVYDHDLYIVIRDDFENFDIEIWKFVFTNFWSKIHQICYTQNFWINLSCATNEKRADCITFAFVFEFYKHWTKKQIFHVKKKYKKFSSIIQKQWKKMKKKITKRKFTNNAFVSTFSNSNQRFENVVFIESTTISKTDFEHMTKRFIEQLFDDILSIDDLIDQSSKRIQKYLFVTINTILSIRNAKNQQNEWSHFFNQSTRDVKNDSWYKKSQQFWKNQFQKQHQIIF